MAFLEHRVCTIHEYEAGLPERVTEENVAIDGIYSMVTLLKPRKPYQALVQPVIINGLQPLNVRGRLPILLSFMKRDGSISIDAHPQMADGHLSVFGANVMFQYGETQPQYIETAYLKERLDMDWMDDDLRSMLDNAVDLNQVNLTSRELQPNSL